MARYRGTADGPDRVKALGAVVLVHAGLAALILAGLHVRLTGASDDSLKIIDIALPVPPPPPPPPPRPVTPSARQPSGNPARQALPTPVVVPPHKVILPAKSPIVAAPVAGTGSADRSGAAGSGSGAGGGGSGNGRGAGGGGGGSGASWASGGLYDSDNPGGRLVGVVSVAFTVLQNGRIAGCSVTRPSGNPELDRLTCALLGQRLQFSPARDSGGRAIPTTLSSTYTWGARRRRF